MTLFGLSGPRIPSRGVLESFFGSKYFMYGCFAETTASTFSQFDAITEPKTILATRDGAILVRCGARGAVWITHLKKTNTPSKKYFKLPATSVLPEEVVASLPVLHGRPIAVHPIWVDAHNVPRSLCVGKRCRCVPVV